MSSAPVSGANGYAINAVDLGVRYNLRFSKPCGMVLPAHNEHVKHFVERFQAHIMIRGDVFVYHLG